MNSLLFLWQERKKYQVKMKRFSKQFHSIFLYENLNMMMEQSVSKRKWSGQ